MKTDRTMSQSQFVRLRPALFGFAVSGLILFAALANVAPRVDAGGQHHRGRGDAGVDVSAPAVGALTNGANHTGTIPVGGGVDTWTISAAAGDSIFVSIGEVLPAGPDPGFTPRIQLQNPAGTVVVSDWATRALDVGFRALTPGTYTVLVSNNFPASQTGAGNYILTVARTPGPYTISSGDEGGSMVNGANHTAQIGIGDQDTWTFDAAFNDFISISIGEVLPVGPDPGLTPRIRLLRPDGEVAITDWATSALDINLRAPLSGTYTVLISNNFPDSQTATGDYILTLAKTPPSYTISPGDDGGPMTNGANHAGVIGIGDQDTWTFDAAFNEYISLSVGEVLPAGPDPGLTPRIRLVRPDGEVELSTWATSAVDVNTRAPLGGTYTVLISNNFPDSQTLPGQYTLTLARSPGPYTVSDGDQGGAMTNGANHTGVIGIGDQDTWTFDAAFNEYISLSIGEVLPAGPDPGLTPRIRLIRPDGVVALSDWATSAVDVDTRAAVAGTYTVLISNNFPDSQSSPGNYVLTVAKSPGPYTISSGDEGGPMINGANHLGIIGIGDQDTWTFEAGFNEYISLSIGETLPAGPDPGFTPRIRLIRPDGLAALSDWETLALDVNIRAPMAGTYTVLISNNFPDSQASPGQYSLTLARSPGPYAISAGDEGGPMTNGTSHTGVIGFGDQDAWVFHAATGNNIILNLNEVVGGGPDPGFTPRIRLIRPDGTVQNNNSGTNSVEIETVAPATGVYTVLVTNNFPNSQDAAANYTLMLTGPTQPAVAISSIAQDEGDSGTTAFTFSVSLSAPVAQAVSIGYATANITATAPVDYTAIEPTTLTFEPGGPMSKLITVFVNGDTTTEPDETFAVDLSGASNVNVAIGHGVASIINDDQAQTRATFDYDGDAKADISVFRPSDGSWYLQQSTAGFLGVGFGAAGDLIAPADYDGDGKTDIAVYRPSTGIWYVTNSSDQSVSYYVFGIEEDLPVPADHDGDGKADISVFRPSTGTWYRTNSSDGSFVAVQFGAAGDRPTIGDFDGDGKADIALFRPSTGAWYQFNSSDGTFFGEQFGNASDKIAPADYDGDGKTDIAIYRPSEGLWYYKNSGSGTYTPYVFGLAEDIPVAGDYDGDGRADLGVFRPSDGYWYIVNSSNGSFTIMPWGQNGDIPTPFAFGS